MRFRLRLLVYVLGIFLLGSCSSDVYKLPTSKERAYRKNLKAFHRDYKHFSPVKLHPDSISIQQWTAHSPNFNQRKPNIVVIHHTEQESCQQSLATLTNNLAKGQVSSHYLICKDGTIFSLVDENYRAWHGGASRWGSVTDLNSVSLGIELDNNGEEPFAEPLISSLLVLLKSIKERYHIDRGNFIGHADIAPKRKVDPSAYFPWQKLAKEGYGYEVDSVLEEVPENFDTRAALRLIGYDVSDLPSAIRSFKIHYIQKDTDGDLTDADKKVLYNIYNKALNYNK